MTRTAAAIASTIQLRPASPEEAAPLSALAFRSKAYWGYSHAFMQACRAELCYTPESLLRLRAMVAERDGNVLGFHALTRPRAGIAHLDALFVEPAFIGQGVGRALLADALARARRLGAHKLLVQSDPHAEGFYARAGARRTRQTPSGSVPGRLLPEMTFDWGRTKSTC